MANGSMPSERVFASLRFRNLACLAPQSATFALLGALPLPAKSADINFCVESVITRLGFAL